MPRKLFERRDVSVVAPELWRQMMQTTTPTGINVTPDVAMTVTAFYAAIRFHAFAVASLPKILYQRTKDGKRRAFEQNLYSLLHDIPNPEMTAFDLSATLDSHVMIRGNGLAELEYDDTGAIKYIWPLRPDKVEMVRNENYELRYLYTLPENLNSEKRVLRPEQVLHLRGLSNDGRWGYAPITMMRNAVALAKATEEYGGAYFGNNAEPGVVLQHPKTLKDEAHKRIKESWEQSHMGLNQSHRMAILEEGMTVEKIGLSPEDSQFLQTRQFQVYEISRMTDVPPSMIFELTNANFSTLEQMTLDFVVHHLRPVLVANEQQMNRSLLLKRERDAGFFVEYLLDGLLRGDLQTRYNAYAIGKQNGWLNTNKILALENMNTIGPKGDVYTVPLNMSVLGEDGLPMAMPETKPVKEPNTPARILLKDAADRIGKRELNEFTNARKKSADKPEKYTAWVDEFYERDYPEFILQVITPFIEAGLLDQENTRQAITKYCKKRSADAWKNELAVYVVDEIVNLFEE